MRLLFDQNLSHRFLDDLFPDSTRVGLLGMAESDDLSIWNFAKTNNLVIVTQNSYYSDWNKLRGAPPKIVWLRCGNASVDQFQQKIRSAADFINSMDSNAGVEVVEVW